VSTQAGESNPERSAVDDLGLHVQREAGPAPRSTPSGTGRVFRLPNPGDPSPPTTKLVAMCAWATGLGLLGLLVAAPSVLAMWRGSTPNWYEPSFIAVGLAGIGLTLGAFMSIQRRRLPWIMLVLATIALVAAIVLTLRAI
jgi:hypothetical protein